MENLFDTINDPVTLDDDFTKNSPKNWNENRFRRKVKKIGKVISQIGYNTVMHPPVLTGVAEVENEMVLDELIGSKYLKDKGYRYIHFDSPDERGIDTALLYREKYFNILYKEAIPLYINDQFGRRDYTRDILYVKGKLINEPIHFLVNHWPSRRAGSEETSYKRIEAAKKNLEIISEITIEDPNAKIIVMGDFNDDPKSESINNLVQADLFNPMELLHTKYSGSLNYKGEWNLFDQIILSTNFLRHNGDQLRFEEAKIFNPKHLQEFKGRFKGNPFRTFVGKKYLGGLSDHFPVYGILSLKKI
jgi:Endonuclease/Exonuclease/phosphatase family.